MVTFTNAKDAKSPSNIFLFQPKESENVGSLHCPNYVRSMSVCLNIPNFAFVSIDFMIF